MVVPRSILFGPDNKDHFEGFKYHDVWSTDFERRVLQNFVFMRRGDAEHNPEFKQPIAYCMIMNPKTNKIFAFQRAKKDQNYFEKRLQGKWSWGVGGHIDKVDSEGSVEDAASEVSKMSASGANPIHTSMLRELKEEIGLSEIAGFKKVGYINLENTSVDQVHFGILYVVETHSEIIAPADAEMDNGMLRTLEELEMIHASPDYTLEGWSEITVDPLRTLMRTG